MICWTRLFRKRLLPLLLAAVMLTGMLPRLTVVAQAEEQGRKIDLTESSVSHHGTTADNTRPKRWVVDGDRTQANYFVTGNDQPQTANTENPANPGYWLQLDLGQKYSITKLNLCIYYDGRYLKDLVVLASNEAEFTKENSQVVYNADSNNFFGLGAGTDSEMPAQNNSAGFDITPTSVVEAQYYGLRRSEVLGLRWSAIDMEHKTISISHKVIEAEVDGKFVPMGEDVLKTKSSFRTLPLIPAVGIILLEEKEKQEMYRRLFKKSYCRDYLDYICVDQCGKLLRPNYVTEHFSWLIEKYGLRKVRFHDLRHTCASLLLSNGISMKQIQIWLGHSTFSTTADIYAHLDYSAQEASANAMNGMFNRPEKEEQLA